MNAVIRLPQMLRDAQVRSGSYDQDQNTIDVIWTTGATVQRFSWADGEFDEELIVSQNAIRLDRLNAGAPFLDTHGAWSLTDVIGSVVRGTAKIEAGKGVATIKLSSAADAIDRVARIKEGSVTNISVGYRVHAVERKEVDGKRPLHRVVDWEPWEISAVPIPADPGAQIRASDKNTTFECQIRRSIADQNEITRIRMEMMNRQCGLGFQG